MEASLETNIELRQKEIFLREAEYDSRFVAQKTEFHVVKLSEVRIVSEVIILAH